MVRFTGKRRSIFPATEIAREEGSPQIDSTTGRLHYPFSAGDFPDRTKRA